MCLYKVTKKIEKPTNRRVEAWGWFKMPEAYDMRHGLMIGTASRCSCVMLDRWNVRSVSGATVLMAGNHGYDGNASPSREAYQYPVGFHKLASEKDAKKSGFGSTSGCGDHILVPVTLRKVRTIGEGDGLITGRQFKCYVADEMYVAKEDVRKARNKFLAKKRRLAKKAEAAYRL